MGHQKNKAHKSKFRTKSSVRNMVSGKVSKGAKKRSPLGNAIVLKKGGFGSGDKERRCQVSEMRRAKARQQTLQTRRFGTCEFGGSRLVTFLPLSVSSNPYSVRTSIETFCDSTQSNGNTTEITVNSPPRTLEHNHRRYTFFTPNSLEPFQAMDALLVCDIVLLVVRVGEGEVPLDAEEDIPCDMASTASTWYSDLDLGVDDAGRQLLTSMNAQGVPKVLLVLQGLRTIASAKRRNKITKLHMRYLRSILPVHQICGAHGDDNTKDIQELMRNLQECGHESHIVWREARPYMLVERVHQQGDNLHLTGFVRGKNMTANQLAHITNYGTFAIDSITTADGETIEASSEGLQPSLESLCKVDELTGEQTWPTEDDYKTEICALQVPEGTSSYQAAWLNSEEHRIRFEEDVADGKTNSKKEVCIQDDDVPLSESEMNDEISRERSAGEFENEDEDDDDGENGRGKKCLEEDPDYIELNHGETARRRLAKYRGLNVFHQHWDPKENLPPHYNRIFAIPDFKRVVRTTTLDNAPAAVGQYVTVALRQVSPLVYQSLLARPAHPIILSGLLPHEQKFSVLHCSMFRTDSAFEDPLPSKHRALYQVGFRRFLCHPLYSDLGRGDRTRYARAFWKEDHCSSATFFAPITHTPAAVLGYIRRDQQWHLVVHGSVLPPNPDFLLLKRAILTGHPAKVHKRQVVVKYMLFNAEDVAWFAPVELRTKHGQRGKIIKAIGSHGTFKASFKNVIQQHDTVYLELWKRVFPKWTTRAYDLTLHSDGRRDHAPNETEFSEWVQQHQDKKSGHLCESALTETKVHEHNVRYNAQNVRTGVHDYD